MATVDVASTRGKGTFDPTRIRPSRTQNRAAYLLLAPTLVVLAIVIGYPIVKALINSLQHDPGLDPATGLFVQGGFAGLDNYLHFLLQRCATADGGWTSCPDGNNAAYFWSAVGVTFFFTAVTVTLETVFGFWMALIMNRGFRGRGIVRAAILVPWAIPTAVSAKLAYFIFAPAGIWNYFFGGGAQWTTGQWGSRFAVILTDTWKTTPFMALLILAGLQLIPGEIYEAAKVDGTGTVQTFLRITLPLVRPALVVAILFRALQALQMFDLPYIFNQGGGGSGHATTTMSILVVNQVKSGYNAASALSTITFLIIFLIAFVFIRFLGADITGAGGAAKKKERRERKEIEALEAQEVRA